MLLVTEKLRKLPNRVYFLHINTIALRRNVTSDFRIYSRDVIVRALINAVSTERPKCGINEKLNQNDDRTIEVGTEQPHTVLI